MKEFNEKLDGILMKYEALRDETYANIENILKNPNTVNGLISDALDVELRKFGEANSMVAAIMVFVEETIRKEQIKQLKGDLPPTANNKPRTSDRPIYDLKTGAMKKPKDVPEKD